MNIISYRGPGMAGGVSAALARAWNANVGTGSLWWHLTGSDITVSADTVSGATQIASIPEEVVKGHYGYCNNFLWPIMHDLPQYAVYNVDERQHYNTFNQSFGWCLLRGSTSTLNTDYFVQDYQLSLLPAFLRENSGYRSVVFWHIPWPKHVAELHVPPMLDIVRGLLQAEAIGFHTAEYASNFLNFVKEHLLDFEVDVAEMLVHSNGHIARVANARWASHKTVPRARRSRHHGTRVIVAPLGIDFDNWTALAARQDNTIIHPSLVKLPFVLSVDRADYTKSVADRFAAIDRFFQFYPQLREKVIFAQICGKTRPGLQSFDRYWQECQQAAAQLKTKWSTTNWEPLLWLDTSFSSAELALLYRSAAMMLVNPVRDGLNLTAKEFVACQGKNPGTLALSSGAGAWQELGKHCIDATPNDIDAMAKSIHDGLVMDPDAKSWRMALLKDAVRSNTLNDWWRHFSTLLDGRRTRPAANLAILQETS